MDNIRLILWKNVRLRLYHPFLTFLEITFPIFVFYQGIQFYNALQNRAHNGTFYPVIDERELYRAFENPYVTIAYTPETQFTSQIISITQKALNANETFSVTNETYLEFLFANRTIFQNHSIETRWLAFAVVFLSTDSDKNVLRYKIRMSKDQLRKDTRRLYNVKFGAPDISLKDEYVKSGFIGLEYTLNKAFISLKTKSKEFPSMNLQQFPYPGLIPEQFPEETIYLLALIGFIFLALSVPHYIASERQSGMKELMKTAGMPEWILWFGWITYSLMIYPISITLVAVILTSNYTGQPFYENVSPLLIWVVLMLYCIANLTFLFAVGTLFSKHWVAVAASVITWFLTSSKWLISIAGDLDDLQDKTIAMLLLCFLPNLVLFNAFRTLEFFEFKGVPTSLSAFMVDIIDPNILHLRYILFLFIINIALNVCVIFYVSAIHPGRYGRKKHILFMFSRFLPYLKRKIEVRITNTPLADNEFIEAINESLIAFRIRHLQKKFGVFYHTSALKDVNFDIALGDITVLIGHNGAGKTTLLNILTGMLSETSGTIMYQNVDVTVDRDVISKDVGYCPQQNVYFPYLTVKQHLLFFAMIKGQSEYRAQLLANEILKNFRMEGDHSKYVQELSEGSRRKLCLALALIKYSKILILDEPTLGMDLMSRRRTWALIKKIKLNRVILITTQDMEEADLLGDRIAVMHDGQVFCYGSGLFLKTTFGTGYNLILSKGANFVTDNVTQLIMSVLPEATLQKDSDYYVLYKLPIQQKYMFPNIFRELETKQSQLDIINIEVSYSTIEQLFLNVHSLAGKKDHVKSVPSSPTHEEVHIERRSGFKLIFHQMKILLSTRMKLHIRRYNRSVVCILLTIILGILNIKVIDWSYMILFDISSPPLPLSLKTYTNAEVIACFNTNSEKSSLSSKLVSSYTNYVTSHGGILYNFSNCHIQQALLDFNKHSPYEYKDNVIVAIEIDDTSNVTVLYNGVIPHSIPIAVNVYTSALMNTKQKGKEDLSIDVINHPFSADHLRTSFCSVDLNTTYLTAVSWWVFIFHSAVICLFASFVAFVISERTHGIQHLQTMSNLSGITYWVGNFIFDYLYFLVIVVILVATMLITDRHGVFYYNDMKAWFIILLLFGVSGLMYSYLFGTFADTISVFLLVNIPLNICFALSSIAFQVQGITNGITFEPLLAFVPTFVFFNIMIRYLFVLINNNHCVYCLEWELPICQGIGNVKECVD